MWRGIWDREGRDRFREKLGSNRDGGEVAGNREERDERRNKDSGVGGRE